MMPPPGMSPQQTQQWSQSMQGSLRQSGQDLSMFGFNTQTTPAPRPAQTSLTLPNGSRTVPRSGAMGGRTETPAAGNAPGQAQPIQPVGQGTPYSAYSPAASSPRPEVSVGAYGGASSGSSQYSAMGRPDPQPASSTPAQEWFNSRFESPEFQSSLAALPANVRQRRIDDLRDMSTRRAGRRGAAQLTPEQRQYERQMGETWQYVRSLTPDQQRALRDSPDSQQMLEDLRRWRGGGNQPAPQQPPSPPASPTPSQSPPSPPPGQGQQPPRPQAGGQFQDLFQQFNFQPPAGFMDALIQRLQGASGGSPALAPRPPSAPQMPPMPSPPPGYSQFGTPQAQQQMYNDSMMAWTMPKQQLLGWGQQAVQQPWAPNYGNMPANSRPMPYEITPNNPFGSGPMEISQNRDAFIGSILNNQANRFVGTQVGSGPVNRPAYDPSQLWGQAQSMLAGGWQNPFAAR